MHCANYHSRHNLFNYHINKISISNFYSSCHACLKIFHKIKSIISPYMRLIYNKGCADVTLRSLLCPCFALDVCDLLADRLVMELNKIFRGISFSWNRNNF